MHRIPLERLQRVNDRRLISNLCALFRRCMPLNEARDAAAGLAALIDGLWLRGTLDPTGLDVERARRLAYEYVDYQLTRHMAASLNATDSPTSPEPSKERTHG